MTDKYKLILLGKIAAGHDKDVVYEKLAIIFEIELKKIPKLLKTPLVIRKNLSRDVVFQYKNGLEHIGVLCDTDPPLKNEFIVADDEPTIDDLDTFSIVDDIEESKELVLHAHDKLQIVNIKMSLGSMIIFMIKWILASIPAILILSGIGYLLQQAIVIFFSDFIS